jgi:hypothetical protein
LRNRLPAWRFANLGRITIDPALADHWAEIRKLPSIRRTDPEAEALRATGTGDAVSCTKNVAPPVARRVGREGVKPSATDRNPNDGDAACHLDISPENKGKTGVGDTGMAFGAERFELSTSCSQSRRASQAAPRPVF